MEDKTLGAIARMIGVALLLAPAIERVHAYQTATPAVTGYRLPTGQTILEAPAGTAIVVVGANLGTGGTIDFNGRVATPTSWTVTAITVVVPVAASYPANGTVRVTTGGQTVFGPPFSILSPTPSLPAISGFRSTGGAALTSATPGTSVVIVGTNLGSSGRVRFNGLLATTTSWTPTAVTAIVPTPTSFPYTGRVQLSTGGQLANGPNFTILAPTASPPTISGYRSTSGTNLSSAPPGTTVVVYGANLSTSGTMTFNGIAVTPSSWTATAITVTVPSVPSYPNTGPVQVTTGGQTATGPSFTITAPPAAAPSITGYRATDGTSLSSATPGTTVVVAGTNLGTAGTVSFNGMAGTASAWASTAVTTVVPTASTFPNSGPIRITTGGQTATGPSFTINAPPAPAPVISGYRTTNGTATTSAAPGTSIVIAGSNLGTTGTVSFNGIAATPSAWTATAITVPVPVAATYPNAGPIRVTTGGQTATGANFTITAPATSTGVQNVRNYGATGNGTTDDRAAIQRALDAARPGESVYFPAGTYFIRATLAVRTSNVRVYGDGDASTVRGDTVAYHLFTVHNSGQTLTAVSFDSLRFLGPRIFDKTVNAGNGVGMNNATNTQFTACTFEGCGTPIADGSNATGTTVNNCRFLDWGNVGIFANAGAAIRNSSFEQHDGSAQDGITSHGVYLHSNSNNCVIENCSFSGVRYYGIQIFGQDAGSTISNVRINGNRFSNNAQDIVVQTVAPTISQISITNNSFSGTRGWPVQLKKGSDLHVDDNSFSGTPAGAVLVGDWSIDDAGGSLTNISVDRNTYSGGGTTPQYVFFLSGARGTLSNVSVQGNRVDAFREPGSYQAAAIYLEEARGATIANNILTMATGAGSVNICAGVRVGGGNSVQVTGNRVEGSGTRYAYGVYALNLANTGSAVTGNTLNHCQLLAGGASASSNTVVYP
jgi:hypothetical protein